MQWKVRMCIVYPYISRPTKVIVLQEAEVANIFSHGDLFYSALVQGELLGHIYVTVWNNREKKRHQGSETEPYKY